MNRWTTLNEVSILPLVFFFGWPNYNCQSIRLGLTEVIRDIEKGDYMKSLTPNSFTQSNEYLESALSPKSVESQTSCRSHDGVFLRPSDQQKKSLK